MSKLPTQSLSTDTRFIMEQSFSTHANTTKSARSPDWIPTPSGQPVARNQKAMHDAATTSLCKTAWRLVQFVVDPMREKLPVDRDDLPIESRTTCKRLAVSMYRPTAGEKIIAEAPRARAYIDRGSKVFGKMDARYKTAPNSKTREFQVERK
jgi:hypothetical protein